MSARPQNIMSVQKPINIPLSGLSTSPSDYSCTDGNLAAAVGVVHEDGAISNFDNPASLFISHPFDESAADGRFEEEVVYIHENDSYCNYIVKFIKLSHGVKTITYGWAKKSDLDGGYLINMYEFAEERYSIMGDKPASNVISVGNILIFFCDDKKYYFRFDYDKYTYTLLGNELPEVNMKFRLLMYHHYYFDKGENKPFLFMASDTIKFDDTSAGITYMPDNDIANFTDAVQGAISYTNNFAAKKDMFLYPFLVRYAIRMYDGTITKHSAPILMLANTRPPYVCIDQYHETSDNEKKLFYHVQSYPHKMQYYMPSEDVEKLEAWKDIIAGVDVFVSQPIYTYNADEKCKRLLGSLGLASPVGALKAKSLLYGFNQFEENYSVSQDSGLTYRYNEDVPISEGVPDYYPSGAPGIKNYKQNAYRRNFLNEIYANETLRNNILQTYGGSDTKKWGYETRPDEFGVSTENYIKFCPVPFCCADVSIKSDEDIYKDIKNCSNFYLAKSLDVDDIPTDSFSDFKFDAGTYENIVAHENMTDDLDSHDDNTPAIVSTYNLRLNAASITKSRFGGFDMQYLLQHSNAEYWNDEEPLHNFEYAVFIKTTEGDVVVGSAVDKANGGSLPVNLKHLCYFFWPDVKAYKAVVFDTTAKKMTTIKLKEHTGLTGAVYCSTSECEWSEYSDIFYESFIEENKKLSEKKTTEKYIVYTSETSNPFVFRAANVEQIGNGTIIALVPAAQALSTGQFGEYPMYAFTTDGVWALYVNDTGGWKSKQPISRDVAVSAESILQLDQSVLFMTERGLMHISGSKIECISEVFDGNDDIFIKLYEQHIQSTISSHTDLQDKAQFPSFKEFAKTGFMHYDYRHQRIYISNEAYNVSFVFSLKDKLWTMAPICATSAINSYPNDLVMAKDGETKYLIDLSADPTDAEAFYIPNDGYILTRPLKLGNPDVLKTIRSMQVRGQFVERSRINQPEASEHHVSLILYGTNDTSLTKWHLVGSVKGPRYHFRYGTPFKFFRVAIICKLSEGESINSLEVVYETKDTNKTR